MMKSHLQVLRVLTPVVLSIAVVACGDDGGTTTPELGDGGADGGFDASTTGGEGESTSSTSQTGSGTSSTTGNEVTVDLDDGGASSAAPDADVTSEPEGTDTEGNDSSEETDTAETDTETTDTEGASTADDSTSGSELSDASSSPSDTDAGSSVGADASADASVETEDSTDNTVTLPDPTTAEPSDGGVDDTDTAETDDSTDNTVPLPELTDAGDASIVDSGVTDPDETTATSDDASVTESEDAATDSDEIEDAATTTELDGAVFDAGAFDRYVWDVALDDDGDDWYGYWSGRATGGSTLSLDVGDGQCVSGVNAVNGTAAFTYTVHEEAPGGVLQNWTPSLAFPEATIALTENVDLDYTFVLVDDGGQTWCSALTGSGTLDFDTAFSACGSNSVPYVGQAFNQIRIVVTSAGAFDFCVDTLQVFGVPDGGTDSGS